MRGFVCHNGMARVSQVRTPVVGDVVVVCKHLRGFERQEGLEVPAHLFGFDRGLGFTRPNGTSDAASYILVCSACNMRVVNNGGIGPALQKQLVEVGLDLKWQDGMEFRLAKSN